ncbi:MAG: PIN domain-containing protein [Gammaproteobacteria bacterium]
MYALDTDTVSYWLRGQGRVAERLSSAEPSAIAVPAIVLHELRYGMLRAGTAARKRAELEGFLGLLTVLPLDAPAAEAAARARLELERAGVQVGPFDILIAGTALASGSTLVTHNTREFSRIRGLRLEDWY